MADTTAWDRAGPPPSHHQHVWVVAEVVDGPSHVGETFEICALCGALAVVGRFQHPLCPTCGEELQYVGQGAYQCSKRHWWDQDDPLITVQPLSSQPSP